MNRLTEKINGEAYVKRYGGLTSICYGCDRVGTCKKKKCGFYHAIEKLAAYEDTGLEPEDILSNIKTLSSELNNALEELKEYKDLEEQGLLMKLPCKVRETVYCIDNAGTKKRPQPEIKEYIIDAYTVGEQLGIGIQSKETGWLEIADMYNIGKTVFLTREEAEKALLNQKS
jgi:hypothetical protein